MMYWTDYGATPKIEMADMDGRNRKAIVTDRLQTPTGLTIDFASYDKVYFCDMKASLIEVMNNDGTNRQIILKQGKTYLCLKELVITMTFFSMRIF